MAKGRAVGLVLDWQDLLQETFARVISGSRRCPTDIEFISFLAQTIRSVASEERRRQYATPTISTSEQSEDSTGLPVAIADESVDVEGEVNAHRILENVHRHFELDKPVKELLRGYQLGETAAETMLRTGLSARDYDAARKRFRRGLPGLLETKEAKK